MTGRRSLLLAPALALLANGEILVGGNFTSYNGTPVNRIVRLNSNGSLDSGFNVGTGANNSVLAIAVTNDLSGDIYIGGSFTSYNGTARNRIARINANGSINTTFAPSSGANSKPYMKEENPQPMKESAPKSNSGTPPWKEESEEDDEALKYFQNLADE